VNGKRSPAGHISMTFVNVRLYEVIRLHRQLFPSSRKRVIAVTLAICGIALVLSVMFLGDSPR
jgi:hypothetical protein